MVLRMAVIGAGIVGLASAVNVQKLFPDARITIIADKFDTDTTSSGAGGLFRPTTDLVKGVAADTLREWVQDSWDFFLSLAISPEAKDSGLRLVPGYVVSDDAAFVQNPVYKDIVVNFRDLSPEDLKKLNLPFKYGSCFTTIIAQPKKFMPWLMRQYKDQGGTVEVGTVNKIEELAGSYDIVVNCCGLGAEKLIPDPSMYAVRGQLELVKAPWIKYFLYCDNENPTYIFPHDDYVVVGGTRDRGEHNLKCCPEVQKAIMQRAEQMMPQIKGAKHVGSWVGLRPARDPLRLEKELKMVSGKRLRVVHNYGHGANGITLSWATGIRAARMVQEWARDITPNARL